MRTKKWTAAVAALVLVAAACGGDDDATDEPAAEEPAAEDSAAEEPAADEPADAAQPASDLEGTLRVLIHQNPAGVEFFENFNEEY